MKVALYSDDLAAYANVYDEDGRRYSFRVEKHGIGDVVFIDGICDRSSAETLRRRVFYVDRRDLKTLDGDQFYVRDLVGQRVEVEGTEEYCEILSVQNYGAGDIIELSHGDVVFLVPFTKDNFPPSDFGHVISMQAFRNFKDVAN